MLEKINRHVSIKEILIFLCFFIFATLMWMGRAMRTMRDKTIIVPIEYVGIPQNIHVTELPQQMSITIRDIGTRLLTYEKQPLSPIRMDLSSQIQSNMGKISISAEQIRSNISDRLLGTTKLQRVTPELIQAHYSVQNGKEVPVNVNAHIIPAAQHQLIGAVTLTPKTILIYGQKQIIDTITCVQTIPQEFPNTQDTFTYSLKLQPIAGVRFSDTIVTIHGAAVAFTEKSFELPITTTQVPEQYTMRLFPSKAMVKARVAITNFKAVNANDFQVICNYPTEPCQSLPVHVTTSNPYILDIRVTPQEVEYIIENK